MFCGNCGANNPEGSTVCGSCGAALTAEPVSPASADAPAAPAKKGPDSKLIGIIAVAVAAVVVVLLLAMLLLGGSAKGNAVKFAKALTTGNAKTIVNSLPDKCVKEMAEDLDYDSKSEMIKDLKDEMSDMKEDLEDDYGKGYKVTVKAVDVVSYEKMDEDRYDDLKDRYEDDFELKLKDAKYVYVYAKIDGKEGVDCDMNSILMVKVGGKWCVDYFSLGSAINYALY